MNGPERDRAGWPLLALAAIVVVTVGWWAAALWPLPPATPEWVARARAACFGSTASGLPDGGGWILLAGTPPSMLAALHLIAGAELRAGLGSVYRTSGGRWVIGSSLVTLLLLGGAAGVRVTSAYGFSGPGSAEEVAIVLPAADLHRFGHDAPALALRNQHGTTVTLEEHRGRVVLVTFAYGGCGTVCPVTVHNVLAARDRLADAIDPLVLVVTLDPWRDTPSRLAHIAGSWGMTGEAHLLGGEVGEVQATLDRWSVERSRDPRNGEIAHASLVYVVDREGRIAYAVTGGSDQIMNAVWSLE